jgi:hypothetical protein
MTDDTTDYEELHRIVFGPRRAKPKPVWTDFIKGADQIAKVLKIPFDAALITLYGLCVTRGVRFRDDQDKPVEECTIDQLENKVRYVCIDDVRDHLRDWSPAPHPDALDTVIRELLTEGKLETESWKWFYAEVRRRCYVVNKHRRFSDRTIRRKVEGLRNR